jgi:DNA-binding HxlR family transcriptional regulator
MASSARSPSPSEIFAERWTPLILRELLLGLRRFTEIRSGMPLISRTLLASACASWKTPA